MKYYKVVTKKRYFIKANSKEEAKKIYEEIYRSVTEEVKRIKLSSKEEKEKYFKK